MAQKRSKEKGLIMAKKYELNDIEVWDGNMAAAHALRQAQVDIVAAYPITPSTPIVQNYSKFLADGYVDGDFIMVESEHSAMSGCVAASAAGARAATATSSQGFALMVEVLYQASGMRLPIVLTVVNRALAAPLNVNGDHADMYLGRDAGWINLCSYNPQEAYDLTLMAFKIAEDKRVRLPAMVHQDGFICSHTAQNVHPLQDEEAHEFVGEYNPVNTMLDVTNPVTHGVQTEEDWHFEFKAQQHHALMNSTEVIKEVFGEFEKRTGRKYDILYRYKLDDADVAIVALGTTVESAMIAADKMRQKGIKAGVLSFRVLRPFPFKEVQEALQNVKAVAMMDRSSPGGAMGALYNEVGAAMLQARKSPVLLNYIYGLGGRDTTIADLEKVYEDLDRCAKSGEYEVPVQQFIGLRGPKLAFF